MTPGRICWPPLYLMRPVTWLLLVLAYCLCTTSRLGAQTNQAAKPAGTNNLLVMIQGKVEVAPSGTEAWAPGRLNPGAASGGRSISFCWAATPGAVKETGPPDDAP